MKQILIQLLDVIKKILERSNFKNWLQFDLYSIEYYYYQKIKKRIKYRMDNSNNSLGLMPFKNKKSMPKSDSPKDLLIFLPETEQKETELKVLSVVNMSVYSLKNNYKDKRKIKEAVTVKRMKLLCKQNIELKKMPVLMNIDKRPSLNFSGSTDYHRRKSDKSPLQIISKPAFTQADILSGNRTFSSPLSPSQTQNRKGLKLDRIQKQNQLSATIFETKPLMTISKSDALINTKLKYYLSSVREGRKLHNLSEELYKEAKKKGLRVKVRRGNNSQLIKWLFKKRWWWTIEEDKEKDQKQKIRPNFIWSQLKQKSFFEPFSQTEANENEGNCDQFCHNHFPQNQYLGNKKALFYNMTHYYNSKKIDVFDRLPLTFHVVTIQDQSWRLFTQKYQDSKRLGLSNIWILKPGENSNRGRGITVHQSYEQIKQIISSGQKFFDSHDSKEKNRTYIVQSYIDKPFLYNKRKFDIRCYMLLVNINKTVKGYWYSEGYIRTSSFEFQLHDFNSFVHLTNDAIQTHSENYGKFEEGNKLSYAQFQKYLDSKYAGCGYDLEKQIVPKMKQIATDSIKAAIHLAKGQKNDRPVFEVFGLDFMIDKNFKPWLIEINTNPCIQTSCLVLEKIIPRMLDDALKLSLDLLFPPPENWPASRKHCLPSQQNKFQLVYDESKDQQIGIMKGQFPSLGVITEDGEFYEQKENDFH